MMKRTLCVALAVCLSAAMAQGAEYVFSTGDSYETMIANHYPVSGGYLFAGSDRSYGGSSWWGASEAAGSNAPAGENTRGLIRFDVSALAGLTETVTNIELRVYQYDGAATDVGFHVITDPNSNWQETSDTGSYSSWGGAWNRTNWNTKLRGLGEGWYRFDFGWEQYYGVGSGGFYETPIASATTTGSGWQSFTLGGDLDALIADWALSPVVAGKEANGVFADPETGTVVDNPGMLMVAQDGIYLSSSEAGLIDPDGIPDNGDEFSPCPQLIVTTGAGGPVGDFDGNGDVDADDIDILCANMGGDLDPYDVNDDGVVDEDDMIYHVETLVEYDSDDDGTPDGNGTYVGDFDLNGVVNATDLQIMKGTFGTSGVGYAGGNANCDTVVNATDLQILKGTFGSAAAGVPEPLTMGLLAIGGAALLRRRK